MAQRITENFIDLEVLPVELHGKNWQIFIDKRIVEVAQRLRNQFGNITINDVYIGGGYNLSGFRPFDTKIGAKYSQHKFGRALDLKFLDQIEPSSVFAYILAHEKEFMNLGLTTIEDTSFTPSWLHIDARYTGLDTIKIIKP
jgi:hypothetical protein